VRRFSVIIFQKTGEKDKIETGVELIVGVSILEINRI
jgi:hypothetical protein